jgi:hypothetical protein
MESPDGVENFTIPLINIYYLYIILIIIVNWEQGSQSGSRRGVYSKTF